MKANVTDINIWHFIMQSLNKSKYIHPLDIIQTITQF